MTDGPALDPDVEDRWLRTRAAVQNAVGETTAVEGRIPGWEPTSLDETLDWLRVHVYEGYYVAFHAVPHENGLTLWVKEWEYGEDEPSWDGIVNTGR